MSDTLAKRRASARGRPRSDLQMNLDQPAAFSANAVQQQQQQQPGGRPAGPGMPGVGNALVGGPHINTTAMMGLQQPSMVPARPSQEHQQAQNAARLQNQLESFGIAALVAPGNEQEGDDEQLRAHGFADEKDTATTTHLESFVPRRGLLKCYLVRSRQGLISTTQRFHLFVEGGDRFILAGRKRANKPTSNFLMSLDQNDLERGSQYFHGKVRANFAGTDFVIYDGGSNPERAAPNAPARRELGAVLYDTNVGGTKGPRKMTVVIPRPQANGDVETIQPRGEEDGLIAQYRAAPDSDRWIVLVNKQPKWNEQLRSYQLNFHGRVSKPSVKNFQLVDRMNPNRVVMQFGKRDDDVFSCDFQAPLSATQAFSVALTAMDNKIACE